MKMQPTHRWLIVLHQEITTNMIFWISTYILLLIRSIIPTRNSNCDSDMVAICAIIMHQKIFWSGILCLSCLYCPASLSEYFISKSCFIFKVASNRIQISIIQCYLLITKKKQGPRCKFPFKVQL